MHMKLQKGDTSPLKKKKHPNFGVYMSQTFNEHQYELVQWDLWVIWEA